MASPSDRDTPLVQGLDDDLLDAPDDDATGVSLPPPPSDPILPPQENAI